MMLPQFLLILCTVLAALSIRAAHTDVLQPNGVDFVGTFCETGLVTHVQNNGNFALECPDGNQRFLFVEKPLDVQPGDDIEVRGVLKRHDNGEVHLNVRQLRKQGRHPPPPPVKVSLAHLSQGDFFYRTVITEGTLVLARQDEISPQDIQLIVKDGSSVLNASISAAPSENTNFAALLGARVRLTGVLLQPAGARRTMMPYLGIDVFEVIRPAPANRFDAPELNFDQTPSPRDILSSGLRRFEGIVLATWSGNQLMVAGKGHNRVKATLALDSELPVAGSPVEIVGYPDTDLYGISLTFARCRPLSDPPPDSVTPPIATTLRHLLSDRQGRPRINGYSHGRLLRLSGKVLDLQPSLRLFSLHADGFTIPVNCSSTPVALKNLEAGSAVEVVVLAVVESDAWSEIIVLPQTRGIKLVLRSADDLHVIARPPFWTPIRLLIVIAALLVIIVLIVLLSRLVNRLATRRKVAERTRLAVELHDSLSQTLAGVTCQIAAGRDAVADDPKTATDLLAAAERMLESSRTELKNCLFDLRNNTVDDPDFVHAITQTLSIFRDETALAIRFPVDRSLLSDTTAHTVLCIIRELVANAVRHGKAAHVRVAGSVEDGTLLFSVSDDGSGFNPARHPGPREGHFGLTGIQERLSTLGGTMKIESTRDKTRVSVSLHCS